MPSRNRVLPGQWFLARDGRSVRIVAITGIAGTPYIGRATDCWFASEGFEDADLARVLTPRETDQAVAAVKALLVDIGIALRELEPETGQKWDDGDQDVDDEELDLLEGIDEDELDLLAGIDDDDELGLLEAIAEGGVVEDWGGCDDMSR